MNLEEIGSFKNKVVSKLINDENILDVLLGDVDNIEDPETALLGKDGSGKGGCVFKYEFVPDTQENSKTFLCVEVVPEETNGDSITSMTIYVFAYCSKDIMQTYRRKGQAGTRVDILVSDIDKILNGNAEFGIGPLEWMGSSIYKPALPYYGRMLVYRVGTFRRARR